MFNIKYNKTGTDETCLLSQCLNRLLITEELTLNTETGSALILKQQLTAASLEQSRPGRTGPGRTGSTLTWFMPALTNSRLGSPLGRTGADGTSRCPCFWRKKSRKVLRTRAEESSGGQPLKERAGPAERRPGAPLRGRSLQRSSRSIWTTDPDHTGPTRTTVTLTQRTTAWTTGRCSSSAGLMADCYRNCTVHSAPCCPEGEASEYHQVNTVNH